MPVTGLTNFDALQTQNRMKAHEEKTSAAVAQLGSGKSINSAKDNSSGAAISSQMESNISVLNQTKVNSANASSLIAVATGAMNEQKDLLIQMKTLATASADESLSSKNRAMVNNEFIQLRDQIDTAANSGRWNGVSLMTGGAGAVSEAGIVTQADTGVVAGPANTLIADATAVSGFVSGTASEAKVSVAGAGAYDASIKIGDQWFESKNITPANDATIRFASTVDSGAEFTLTFAGAVTGITNATTFQTALNTTLGLTGGGANANFLAASVAPANGLTGLTASSSTAAGTYAFRYDAGSNQLTLTDGKQKWTEAVATTGAAQSITFANGITANLDNTFAVGTSVTQTVVDVARADEVSLNFQIAEKSTDILNIKIAGTTLSALGLSGLDVSSSANAASTSAAIDKAFDTVNAAYSTLGAQQKRFESIQSNLDTRVENLTAAKSKIGDADIAKAMADQVVSSTMSQISSVALSQSFQITQQLLSIVRG